ncbi:hypothetical protein [Myxacorys almedinensis]|uniref:Uncharacterized protein n=1 Tax=Myxacorys almedinensis A TaxID=2690445 RepID=A0A8J7Z0G6_9CYAN|nr:hypothetical protein [Myxacorys almedinensis]NDJ17439.1 hypothetical protein [Myxacorys almedinensis A]
MIGLLIALERFDYTLEQYGKPKALTLAIVEAGKPKLKAELDLAQLWKRYKEVRTVSLSRRHRRQSARRR